MNGVIIIKQLAMMDIINNAIKAHADKGQRLEAIKNYIKKRYNIVIDNKALQERLRSMKIGFK